MKSIFLTVAVAFASQLVAAPAFAAKFRLVPSMESPAARALSKAAAEIIKDDVVYGDASGISAFGVKRAATEKDVNTMKQLNFAKGGVNSDDSNGELLDGATAEELADFLLEAVSRDPEDEVAFAKARLELIKALEGVKASPGLKVYGATHADEDGSWQILDIFDVAARQVLFVRVGYYGT